MMSHQMLAGRLGGQQAISALEQCWNAQQALASEQYRNAQQALSARQMHAGSTFEAGWFSQHWLDAMLDVELGL